MDARGRYFRHMQDVGRQFEAGRGRIGPMRELSGGGRVVAVLPAAAFHHLHDFHGVTLGNRDEVDWLRRHHPETFVDGVRKPMVTGASVGTGMAPARGRLTRFGRAAFHKVY